MSEPMVDEVVPEPTMDELLGNLKAAKQRLRTAEVAVPKLEEALRAAVLELAAARTVLQDARDCFLRLAEKKTT